MYVCMYVCMYVTVQCTTNCEPLSCHPTTSDRTLTLQLAGSTLHAMYVLCRLLYSTYLLLSPVFLLIPSTTTTTTAIPFLHHRTLRPPPYPRPPYCRRRPKQIPSSWRPRSTPTRPWTRMAMCRTRM